MSYGDDIKNAIINGDINKVKEEYNIHSTKSFFYNYCGGEFVYNWQFKFQSYDRQENRTPLMVALEAQQFEMAKFLLENGNDINKGIIYYDFNRLSNYIYEESPLFVFCKKGQFEIVKFLLENGANVNSGVYIQCRCVYSQNWSPLMFICRECINEGKFYGQYLAIIKILVEYGAEVIEAELEKCYGYEYERVKEEKVFKSIMAHIKQVPLLNNVKSGNLEKIRQCLASGMDVNFVYAFSKTALMYACQKGNFEVALTLISAGANINAKDKSGKTVLKYAAEGGNAEIMKILLAQGAKSE